MRRSRESIPVRSADLTIHDVAFGGKGVARDGGKAVFVPFTVDGERITARNNNRQGYSTGSGKTELAPEREETMESLAPFFCRSDYARRTPSYFFK